jgi:hypothetical protein
MMQRNSVVLPQPDGPRSPYLIEQGAFTVRWTSLARLT